MAEIKYKLYAIRTEDLPTDGLKGFEYSLQANGRYCLVYCNSSLTEPYRLIREDVALTHDESAWLMRCKTEINLRAMKENEEEYTGFLNTLLDNLETELKIEQKKAGDKK